MPSRASSESKLPDAMYKVMQGVLDTLFAQKDEDGRDISEIFHDLVSKRSLPDYYKVIKTPMAMNPVQNSIKKKGYTTFAAFVKDCAQIFHNAKVYNMSGSQVYEDAVTMEVVLETELRKLNNEGVITEADATLPDLGPIPPPSPEVSQVSDPEDDSADEDDEDDEEEETTRRKSKRKRLPPRHETIYDDGDDDGGRKDDPRRKRGRPPRVDTPMECRIKNIMKGLRKCKDEHGNMRVAAFERLPDAKQFPDYYQEIKNPIALDGIRKRIKRREYKSVEQFEVDIRQMCENAKDYNRDDSQIFRDAVALEEELANLAEAEKARDDSEFQGGAEPNSRQGVNKQMRIPLKSIEHKGETYVIGDWVHIINPNDLSKPTVAQVYRTWEDSDGQKWINACWYYRPEQTVHRYDRRFYEHEVVKTGQYRDHQIDEVLDKCFVMFFTRYSRGRPKGIGNRQVYVCESRYNEAEKHFNKIKTWKSCIPDEVRGQDYEMDLFEKQEPLKKFPSPIAHLLPPNATETDPIPEAKMGAENAPPIVGAVFKRPRGPNDSPPLDPTPPPQSSISSHTSAPTPKAQTPAVSTPSIDYHENLSMTQMYKQAHLAASLTPAPQPTPPAPTPAAPPATMHHRPPSANQHMMQSPMVPPQYPQQPPQGAPLVRQGSMQQQYAPVPMQHSPSPHMYAPQPQHHVPVPQPQMQQPMYAHQQPYVYQPPMQPQAIHHQMPPHPGMYASPQVQHQQYPPPPPPTPHMQAHQAYAAPPQPVHHQPVQYTPAPPPPQMHQPQMHRAPTMPPQGVPPSPHPSAPVATNVYPPPSVPPSTFTLPEATTSGIPESIAEQFLRDEEGRILWFTVPPLETPASSAAGTATKVAGTVANGPIHSLEYLAKRKEMLARKRKRSEERKRELKEEGRRRDVQRMKDMRSVRGVLGKVLKVWGGQLKV